MDNPPKPITILVKRKEYEAGKPSEYRFDFEAAEKLFLREDIRDLPLVPISIAGGFKTGKSFLLDLLTMFGRAQAEDRKDWIPDLDKPMNFGNFDWCGGAEPNTQGIVVSGEIIKLRLSSGKQVGILFTDTQGLFDSDLSMNENCAIFALSALISSVLNYNLKGNINKADVVSLQMFVHVAAAAKSRGFTSEKLFQKLNFVVRDWESTYDYELGVKGGSGYLSSRRLPGLDAIFEQFQDVGCVLFPHPGREVTRVRKYEGPARGLDADFVRQIEAWGRHLLDPENLRVATVSGQKLTGNVLMRVFSACAANFTQGLISEDGLLEAYIDIILCELVSNAADVYLAEMKCLKTEGDVDAASKKARTKALEALRGQSRIQTNYPLRTHAEKKLDDMINGIHMATKAITAKQSPEEHGQVATKAFTNKQGPGEHGQVATEAFTNKQGPGEHCQEKPRSGRLRYFFLHTVPNLIGIVTSTRVAVAASTVATEVGTATVLASVASGAATAVCVGALVYGALKVYDMVTEDEKRKFES